MIGGAIDLSWIIRLITGKKIVNFRGVRGA